MRLLLRRSLASLLTGACLFAASVLLPSPIWAAGSVTLVIHQKPFDVAQHDIDGH